MASLDVRGSVNPDGPQGPEDPVDSEDPDYDLDERDLVAFVDASIKSSGFVGYVIEQYDQFVKEGVPYILQVLFRLRRTIEVDAEASKNAGITGFTLNLRFVDVSVGAPVTSDVLTGLIVPLLPTTAANTGGNYAGPLVAGSRVEITAHFVDGRSETRAADVPRVVMGSIPIMVRSALCHTTSMSREALIAIGADPADPGGYFVLGGRTFAVEHLENIRYNAAMILPGRDSSAPPEVARAEFISQPGGAFENSSQTRAKLTVAGSILIQINSTRIDDVHLPFWLICRLFGMSDDRDIVAVVAGEGDTPLDASLAAVVNASFFAREPRDNAFEDLRNVVDRTELLRKTAERLMKYLTNTSSYESDEEAVRFLIGDLLGTAGRPGGLDRIILPHQGLSPESRIQKLRLLGAVIRDMILAAMGVIPYSVRDNYAAKRVHGAAVSLAKSLKTQVNVSVIEVVVSALSRMLRTTDWKDLSPAVITDTMLRGVQHTDLGSALNKAIRLGMGTIQTSNRGRSAVNRLSSIAMERKNQLNTFKDIRTISTQADTAAKGTERATDMRSVDGSTAGTICCIRSPDTGDDVGIKKDPTVGAVVFSAANALPLIAALAADPAVVPLDDIPLRGGGARALRPVYVDGRWVGGTPDPLALTQRYRLLRRAGSVAASATIAYDPPTGAVHFWLDSGRIAAPFLIVYNNYEEFIAARREARAKGAADPVPYRQWVRFTRAHVRAIRAGRLTLEGLVAEGVVEYLTAQELANCYVAPSIRELRRDRGDPRRRYTHLMVEQALLGFAAHVSPCLQNTQPARTVLETNQAAQSAGWPGLNWPFRVEKGRMVLFHPQRPVTYTLSSRHILPSGANGVVAIISGMWGDNQEDSAILNKKAVEAGFLQGIYLRSYTVTLARGQAFCVPDPVTTSRMKHGADYSQLAPNGLVRVGALVTGGTVLVGCVAALAAGADPRYTHSDCSEVYTLPEPARVVAVTHVRPRDGDPFVVVQLTCDRPLEGGDKASTRQGNKAIVARIADREDLPFDDEGNVPDFIMNSACVPTRMTIGQLIESLAGRVGARRGAFVDGTAFIGLNFHDVCEAAEKVGLRYNGRRRMYCGITGRALDAAIFCGVVFIQRLMKFGVDEAQKVGATAPTDPTTGQPIGGKRLKGGLRIGEMERHCQDAQGAAAVQYEKCFVDSDGVTAFLCRRCGDYAAFNRRHGIAKCKRCGELADIAALPTRKSVVVVHETIAGTAVRMQFVPTPRRFEVR